MTQPSMPGAVAQGLPVRASRREDLITMTVGTWLLIGLFVDGWAHSNLGELESFFTPWHGVFYSGFAATCGWFWWVVRRSQAIPVGYRLGLIGIGLFGLGGLGDMIWHLIFGIEANTEALLSPTHLLLFLGGVLITSTPARAAWSDGTLGQAPSFRSFLPALLSVTFTAAFVLFLNMFSWGFRRLEPFGAMLPHLRHIGAGPGQNLFEAFLISAIVQMHLTTIILMAPVLYMMRRWRLPTGSLTLMFTVIAVLMGALGEYRDVQVTLVPPVLGGIIADIALQVLRPSPERTWALRAFAGLVPVVLWSIYMLMGSLSFGGMLWSVHLWTGVVAMSALIGFGLSILIIQPDHRSV